MNASNLLTTVRDLAPLDLIGLGLVALLVALGIWRGLWWQVIRLLGLVLAVALARVFAEAASDWIVGSWPDLEPRLAHGIAWVSVFLLTLGAASVFGLLGQRLIEAMQLGLVNRLGGAVLGAVTGIVVHVALLVVVCQLAPEEFVARHVGGTFSERLVAQTGQNWRVVLGAEAAGEVDRVLALPVADSAPPPSELGGDPGSDPNAEQDIYRGPRVR